MFAQLSYANGASAANVLSDIAAALSGGTIAAMSASLNKPSSSIDNGPGGAASWTYLADSATMQTDTNAYTSSVTTLGAKVLKQAATTSFGTQDKYLKFGFLTFSATPTRARFASYLGKNQSAGILSGTSKPGSAGLWHCTAGVAVVNAGVFSSALRINIYSSATATLISIAEGDLFAHTPCMTVFDFARNSPDLELAGNLCTVISNGQSPDISSPTPSPYMYMAETTVDGKLFSTGGTAQNNRTPVVIGTPLIENVLTYLTSTTPSYKFAGFSTIGTQFDLLNIGVTHFSFITGEVQGQTYYSDHVCNKQIHYSSITDVCGVYGCHVDAFGKSGSFYQTVLGTMCKFGPFMVQV